MYMGGESGRLEEQEDDEDEDEDDEEEEEEEEEDDEDDDDGDAEFDELKLWPNGGVRWCSSLWFASWPDPGDCGVGGGGGKKVPGAAPDSAYMRRR